MGRAGKVTRHISIRAISMLSLLSGFKGYLIGGAAILVIGALGFMYVRWSQAEIQTLQANLEIVKTQADSLQAANVAIRADVERTQRATDALAQTLTQV